MRMFIKNLSLFLLFALIVALICGCGYEQAYTDISVNVTAESSEVTSKLMVSAVTSEESEEEISDALQSTTEESSLAEDSIVAEDTVVTVLACPDNLIHPSIYYDAIERAAKDNGTEPDYSDLHNAVYDFAPIYKNVAEQIAQADIAFLNQETLIGGDIKRISGYPCFNTPLAMGETVVDLGFDIVNIAHNHMLDSHSTDFLEYCNSFFEEREVEVIGYYPSEESTNWITVIEQEGIRVAFLTYTYGTNGLEVQAGNETVIPLFDDELIEKQVELAKECADVIIAVCHWGYENTYNPNDTQEYYAEYFCELGVDVVLGMHPHCIQPMEWMTSSSGKRTLIVYSLGNFVSGMQRGMNMLAGMLSLEIVKDGETEEITIESPLFIPTVTHYVRGSYVADDDTGFRDYEIFHLSDYTEELASMHAVHRYESSNGTTLEGGKFSKETLLKTLYEYIDDEFLPKE